MKALMNVSVLILLPLIEMQAQVNYTSSKGYVSFLANAPVADVDAHNNKVKVALNTSTAN
jgi:hypothetical protein